MPTLASQELHGARRREPFADTIRIRVRSFLNVALSKYVWEGNANCEACKGEQRSWKLAMGRWAEFVSQESLRALLTCKYRRSGQIPRRRSHGIYYRSYQLRQSNFSFRLTAAWKTLVTVPRTLFYSDTNPNTQLKKTVIYEYPRANSLVKAAVYEVLRYYECIYSVWCELTQSRWGLKYFFFSVKTIPLLT